MKNFPMRLKERRKALRLTQGELAIRLNVHRTAYTKYEIGIAFPSLLTFRDLCVALDTSADELLGLPHAK